MVEISAKGPMGDFEAIGRFLAMSVLHGVPMNVELPATYLSRFFGQGGAEYREDIKQRLVLMSSGFRAVIEADDITEISTIKSLGRLIRELI